MTPFEDDMAPHSGFASSACAAQVVTGINLHYLKTQSLSWVE